ncbi:IS5/IS1182 family transposase [Xenorhabdus poinarii]|nr:IS5/IS1182 family transposase [Xenorhabdus poinarii]
MMPRSALKKDKRAAEYHRRKIDELGDPLLVLDQYVDFSALADTVDRVTPRIISPKGGRPPFPTEVMVRIIILKHFHNLSDEKREYQLLDHMSWQRFCRLTDVINIPDRNTIWYFEKRIGQEGARALFDEAKHPLSAHKKIAKTRARVEHIFGSFSQMGDKFIRTVGQLRANVVMTLKATCYDLQRLVYFRKSSIHAF